MIRLNLNENKRLKFSYGVANVHPEDIMGKFILDFGDAQLGFPITVNDGKIVVDIKNLKRFLIEGSGIVKARLEIVASDTFLTPWSGEVKISGPIKMTVEEDKPAFEYVEEKPLYKDDEDNLRRLLSLKEEEIVEEVKDEEVKESENIFSNFLNTPIEELI